MAYVLVAVGALMAAAGLYVIGFGWIEARYEEYWNALGAGATLTAGGTITLALGFAVRALLQVKAAFVAQPTAAVSNAAAEGSAGEPTLAIPQAAPPETSGVEPVEAEPAAVALGEADQASAQPSQQLEFAIPPAASGRHPLRPPPAAPRELEPTPVAIVPVVDTEAASEPPLDPPAAIETSEDGARHPQPIEPDRPDPAVARPADDYKLETPSTPEHDLPPPSPAAPTAEPKPVSLPRARDWFDRALADIDEELPLVSSTPRETPASTPVPQTLPVEPVEEPELEPAAVGAEPASVEAAHEEPAVAPPTAPTEAAVIGRYEAEGTSYVMYADGSIEAQSSAGVYRFGSMAELKAFIES